MTFGFEDEARSDVPEDPRHAMERTVRRLPSFSHGDLKLENLLTTSDGGVVLVDLGEMQFADTPGASVGATALTAPKQVAWTAPLRSNTAPAELSKPIERFIDLLAWLLPAQERSELLDEFRGEIRHCSRIGRWRYVLSQLCAIREIRKSLKEIEPDASGID